MYCNTQQFQGNMNCHSNHHGNQCGCGTGGQQFLSKKKRIEILSKHMEGLQERAKDIEDYIAELKKEK